MIFLWIISFIFLAIIAFRSSKNKNILLFLLSIMIVFASKEVNNYLNKNNGSSPQPQSVINKLDTKISAYIDNTSPSKNSIIYLTVKGPPGGKVIAVSHFKANSVSSFGILGNDGFVVIPITIGDEPLGFLVVVDVKVDYNNKTYRTNVYFTPK